MVRKCSSSFKHYRDSSPSTLRSQHLIVNIHIRHRPKIFFLSPYNHIISEACWSTFLLQFCSKIAVSFLQALFRKISKKNEKNFSIKWERPRGESNPGLWVDRQVSNPLYYEGFTKWVVKNKNIFQMSKISKLLWEICRLLRAKL